MEDCKNCEFCLREPDPIDWFHGEDEIATCTHPDANLKTLSSCLYGDKKLLTPKWCPKNVSNVSKRN